MENPSNNDDNNSTRRSISEKIQDYVLEHLLTVMWSFSLLIGGFIFWLYFFQIEYLPDLNFQEIILFLAAAALLGLVYVCGFFILLLSPTIIYSLFLWEGIVQNEDKGSKQINDWLKNDIARKFMFFSLTCILGIVFIYHQADKLRELVKVFGIVFGISIVIVIVQLLWIFFQEKFSFSKKISQMSWKENIISWFFLFLLQLCW